MARKQRRRIILMAVAVVFLSAAYINAIPACAAKEAGAPYTAREILDKIGVERGICAVVGDGGWQLAIEVVRNSDLTLLVQLKSAADVRAACRAVDRAGFYGTRIYIEKGEPARIHLADNLADALVAAPGTDVAAAEALRVIRPQGKAILGGRELIKPFPEGIDDWSHHYHGPDNNTQSNDLLARAPYITQFIAEPRYSAAPQAAVVSGGRVFLASGHIAWHEREERTLNALFALNAFNGTLLWKRKLTPGIMVDRNTMVATPDTLYLADDKSCKFIEPATGEMRDEIIAPPKLTGGSFWKWLAMEDGTLYGLVGKQEEQDPVAKWRRRDRGWRWDEISKGYHEPDNPWGAGDTLMAIDPQTKEILWHRRETRPIDSRGLCMKNARIYYCLFGREMVCLDAKTGKDVWRRTSAKDPDLFKAIGPYRPGQGFLQGWRTAPFLRCTAQAVYFGGPQVTQTVALSAENGDYLWTHSETDTHVLIRDDGVYIVGRHNAQRSWRLHPLTGKVLKTYKKASRCACTRSTGSVDSILFRGGGGTNRLDLATGKVLHMTPMRPSCMIGLLPAQGHLYWLPWVCDCNLQMFGVICCQPAGAFKFDRKAANKERLERPAGSGAAAEPLAVSPADWPTYRADNARSGHTRASVAEKVRLLWRITPHVEFEPTAPVAAGGMVLLGGSDGIVRALDAITGEARWTSYTGGSVRYPPSIAEGRALVGSGDGWAYALEAATGRLLWRFRAAPLERKIHVYGSLLSTWPVAGGALVEEGVAYCAAGINNYDGTHVYALDAATGEIKWQNNTSGHLYAPSPKGVSVQGDMLLHDGKLYLAGGNEVSPGVYDIADGTCLSAKLGKRTRRGRELVLAANGTVDAYGQPFYSRPEQPVFDRSVLWDDPVVVTANARLSFVSRKDADVASWALAARTLADDAELWNQPLPDEPVRWGMAVDAAGRVFVTLRNGEVLCFGKKQ